jgi:hypothetical protein
MIARRYVTLRPGICPSSNQTGEFVINLRPAKALGLTFSESALLLADEVIRSRVGVLLPEIQR